MKKFLWSTCCHVLTLPEHPTEQIIPGCELRVLLFSALGLTIPVVLVSRCRGRRGVLQVYGCVCGGVYSRGVFSKPVIMWIIMSVAGRIRRLFMSSLITHVKDGGLSGLGCRGRHVYGGTSLSLCKGEWAGCRNSHHPIRIQLSLSLQYDGLCTTFISKPYWPYLAILHNYITCS